MKKSATFSDDRKYRYTLWREWNSILGVTTERKICTFIGLNPSTADETEDDPTIRRCIQFAKDFGCNALCMLNLFAFRATDPKVMLAEPDPVGFALNDWYIRNVTSYSNIVVAAWGTNGGHLDRDKQVVALVPNLQCLRVTKDGHPAHPLYLPKDLRPIPFPKGDPNAN